MARLKSFIQRFKTDPIIHLIGLFSILLGILFFLIQTVKLFHPERAEIEMAELPFGRFDWGYVWADTFFTIPLLIIGGILLLMICRRAQRLGQMLTFAGLAINVYAMFFFWVGFAAVGETVPGAITGAMLLSDVIFVVICLLSIIYLGVRTVKEASRAKCG